MDSCFLEFKLISSGHHHFNLQLTSNYVVIFSKEPQTRSAKKTYTVEYLILFFYDVMTH